MRFSLPQVPQRGARPKPEPGIFSYPIEEDGQRTHIHLRIHEDGSGLLLVNANRSFHLNPTALRLAWLILEGLESEQIVSIIRKEYKVSARRAKIDLNNLRIQLNELMRTNGACPIHQLELDVLPPFSQLPSAPYRMDLAITYRCNCECAHCYNARSRDFPGLNAAEWKRILDKLWEIGIPHICFTGGEATLHNDLPELISYAKDLGQITGLLSNGRRLSDPKYVDGLVEAGLDHVQITLESHIAEVHDRMVGSVGAWKQTVAGIRNVLDRELYVMTNSTLLQENAFEFGLTIDFLAELGVPTVGCNALIYAGSGETVGTGLAEGSLEPILEMVREKTDHNGQRLIWYTPTQYCHFDPVQMELGVKGCTAAMYNMCVEPNGDVIPCQSYYQPVGNLLQDSWDDIWNHDLSIWLRERQYVPDKCTDCPILSECGGGCPLSLSHQSPVEQIRSEVVFT
jgi:radical SAM protein with 4Fe4S-binding SPASM domain